MLQTLRRAFPVTTPVLAGYLFLGLAYGASMRAKGLSAEITALNSLFIYGGSLQFALIDPLTQAFAPLTVALLSLLVQARHLFYGLTMLEAYNRLGWKKLYPVVALTDETYSLVVRGVPSGEDPARWYTAVSALDQLYWVTGSVAGALIGQLLPTEHLAGIDFAMTALFAVIVTEQTQEAVKKMKDGGASLLDVVFAPLLGAAATIFSLMTIGKGSFLLLAMALILAGFAARYAFDRKEAGAA